MYKKYCLSFLFIFLILPIVCFGLNFFIDPFKFFNHKSVNFVSCSDERNLKLAFLKNNPLNYNAVMLGSSRSSYIDVELFKNYKMFNLSVSGISIDEYLPYLRFFEKTQGTPKVIVLSFDAHSANVNFKNTNNRDSSIKYGNSTFKQLLEYAKIKTLCTALNLVFTNVTEYYDENLVKIRTEQTKGLNEAVIKVTLNRYKHSCFKKYRYNDAYKEILESIKQSFPEATIVVIISPIHESLFSFQVSIMGEKDCSRWLNDLNEVFSAVIDFNHDKDIVSNPNNFFDPSHFYPFLSQRMVHKIIKEGGI
jgi:hypothetical protein